MTDTPVDRRDAVMNLRLLWSGQLVSQIGSEVTKLALPLYALSVLHATSGEVGVLRAAALAPVIVAMPLIGVWIDRLRRRPVLLAGLGLMVAASLGCSFAETLPQLIAARFLQALGGASGMVISRAIIRDLFGRDRIGAMISLVIAVMMIAQMLSPLTGGLLETAFGWRSIFYVITAASLVIAVAIAFALPETRRDRAEAGGFRGDVGSLFKSRAFIGYLLCQVLASQIIFAFAGGGPYIVVMQMGRSSAEYGAWFATTGFAFLIGNLFCVRFAPRSRWTSDDSGTSSPVRDRTMRLASAGKSRCTGSARVNRTSYRSASSL